MNWRIPAALVFRSPYRTVAITPIISRLPLALFVFFVLPVLILNFFIQSVWISVGVVVGFYSVVMALTKRGKSGTRPPEDPGGPSGVLVGVGPTRPTRAAGNQRELPRD